MQNMDWFTEAVGEFDDDYLLIDCPGEMHCFVDRCSFSKTHVVLVLLIGFLFFLFLRFDLFLGQIELYSHSPVMKSFTKELQRLGYTVCSIYLIDAQVYLYHNLPLPLCFALFVFLSFFQVFLLCSRCVDFNTLIL